MRKQKTTEVGTRSRIYEYILEYPGLHLRELSRKLEIPVSTLKYHLRHLEKHGLIVVNSEERYDRVYVTKNIGQMEKKIIHAMRQEALRDIILYIGASYVGSQAELSKELELSSATVGKHLKRLVDLGIIEPAPIENGVVCTSHKDKVSIDCPLNGREVMYRLTMPTNTDLHTGALIGELLSRYKKGLSDDTAEAVLEYLNLVNPNRKFPKKVKNNKKFLERFITNMYETFPHPYHV